MSEMNETRHDETATSHSYAPGTILGTKWGLVEVQSDGSHKPVSAADVEGRPRMEADSRMNESYPRRYMRLLDRWERFRERREPRELADSLPDPHVKRKRA